MVAQRSRRHGQEALIWLPVEKTNSRGNTVLEPNLDQDPDYRIMAWLVPQRGARAEVPGQMQIRTMEIGTKADLTDVGLWARVRYAGDEWDVTAPPQYHHGTRHVRHWTAIIKQRPS